MSGWIRIRGAREHNLRNVDADIPREGITLVTGVSGSGKSSLVMGTLYREAQRRFLESLPAFARTFQGGLGSVQAESLEGLGPPLAVGQRMSVPQPRSTVGTLSEVYDLLRLLFARAGCHPEGCTFPRGAFSFNSPEGACPVCQGLGVEDRLDPTLLVADAAKSLREGALRVSTPNGYLMYSQVTVSVLDQVLRAHGGDVDTPWKDLSEAVRQVVWYGSDRLKVPFGKHTLESRMRWTGITARPQQEGFYRGLLPTMEEILRVKRNPSILRFARSQPCTACQGARLRPEILRVTWAGRTIAQWSALNAHALAVQWPAEASSDPVVAPIQQAILERCRWMGDLGLGALAFDRPAPSLSPGEAQRLRLLSLLTVDLTGMMVLLDEPSAGLHPVEVARLAQVLEQIRARGQTVVVVDHDPGLRVVADWQIEMGPGAGTEGGAVVYQGVPRQEPPVTAVGLVEPGPSVTCSGPAIRTTQPLQLRMQGLNVVCGLSGSGKSTLLNQVAAQGGGDPFRNCLRVDDAPIGRTPRSNLATYTGLMDGLRDAFAATSDAKARGLGRSQFSFNTPGGRCEACEGAGVLDVGLRYHGRVTRTCDTCQGQRFHQEVLTVQWRGRTLAELLEATVSEAAALLADLPRFQKTLAMLEDLGLGYLRLGQPATSLSGGEAQRIKLAAELGRLGGSPALILLDEPTAGLHDRDGVRLLGAFDRLLTRGHTLLVADNRPLLVRAAHHRIELGPAGDQTRIPVIRQGPPGEGLPGGPVALALKQKAWDGASFRPPVAERPILLRGATTHCLKGVDLDLPPRGLTVVTGPSGSGKSSLVWDTIVAEGQARMGDLVAPWARRFLPRGGGAALDCLEHLPVVVAIPQAAGRRNPRSTLGTLTGMDERLRLMWARLAAIPCPGCGHPSPGRQCTVCGVPQPTWTAGHFSPRTPEGACPACHGLGFQPRCHERRLVVAPERALGAGVIGGTRYGRFLEEPDGQHLATLRTALDRRGWNLDGPWKDLAPEVRELVLHGTGDETYTVTWRFRRGRRSGEHVFQGTWPGLLTLMDREFARVHDLEEAEELEALLVDQACIPCGGTGLQEPARRARLEGATLPEVLTWALKDLGRWLRSLAHDGEPSARDVVGRLNASLLPRVEALCSAGLDYLALGRETFSLSGGESQRARLAVALCGGLEGVLYALEEPTRGLHPTDRTRLASMLRTLGETNAVLVVTHDAELIQAANHQVVLGPDARGGRVVYQGPPRFEASTPAASDSREPGARVEPPGWITVRGAAANNLKGEDVCLPVGCLVGVAGPSGSGKSTLVMQVLGPSLDAWRQGLPPMGCLGLDVSVPLEAVHLLPQIQSPSGRTPWILLSGADQECLFQAFSRTPEARRQGLKAKDFSLTRPGGRCETCAGGGVQTVSMDLLPDVNLPCPDCQGQRYQDRVLHCRQGGWNLADLMGAPLAEVLAWAEEQGIRMDAVTEALALGLGYLSLGQSLSTLSDGEYQRVRLAQLLARQKGGRAAWLLDEPAAGLDPEARRAVVRRLRTLAEAGHLVILIEHDSETLAAVDWVLHLGPGSGPDGGRICSQGWQRA